MCVCVCAFVCVFMYIYTHTHIYIYVCVCVCARARACACISLAPETFSSKTNIIVPGSYRLEKHKILCRKFFQNESFFLYLKKVLSV